MAKKELKMRAVVAPTETVIVSAYDKDGKADACTLAFLYGEQSCPTLCDHWDQRHTEKENPERYA